MFVYPVSTEIIC